MLNKAPHFVKQSRCQDASVDGDGWEHDAFKLEKTSLKRFPVRLGTAVPNGFIRIWSRNRSSLTGWRSRGNVFILIQK